MEEEKAAVVVVMQRLARLHQLVLVLMNQLWRQVLQQVRRNPLVRGAQRESAAAQEEKLAARRLAA